MRTCTCQSGEAPGNSSRHARGAALNPYWRLVLHNTHLLHDVVVHHLLRDGLEAGQLRSGDASRLLGGGEGLESSMRIRGPQGMPYMPDCGCILQSQFPGGS